MQQRAYVAVAVGLLCVMLSSATVPAAPSVYPTGVTRYDPGKAYNVFILFSGADDKTHLIDMDGNEVLTHCCRSSGGTKRRVGV